MLKLKLPPWQRDGAQNVIALLMFACMHGHFRDDPRITPIVVKHALKGFEINLLEPNLSPQPVTTGELALAYEERVRRYCAAEGHAGHRLIMTIYLTEHTTADDIGRAYGLGIRVAKLYYKVTTNSAHGVTHWREAETAIAAMEVISRRYPDDPMFLQVHAEALGPEHHEREAACVEHMESLVASHPDLWVAIEHVTTRVMLGFVARHKKVGASITLHHLLMTWDDDCVHDGCLDGHHFCAPVCKTEDDRQALLDAAFGRVPALANKVWLGLDFAPHLIEFKDGSWPWPPKPGDKLPNMGMYTLDVAVPLLVALFECYGSKTWQAELERFASTHGPAWYRIAPPQLRMIVRREPWQVPEVYLDHDNRPTVRSFIAGQWVDWRVEETHLPI